MYRALIVEDDRSIAKLIKEQAQMWDIDCRMVENFRDVLADFTEYQPHIVLLDIGLPIFNGYHWCSEIRKISKVPIIFISSLRQYEYRDGNEYGRGRFYLQAF